MKIIMHCEKCKSNFECFTDNTIIRGPVVETKCPKCKSASTKNFSAVLDDMTCGTPGRLSKINVMMGLAGAMAAQFNDDDTSVKRSKKK